MAKDAYYFSHDSNARNDLKMIKLRRKLGLKGVGLFWCVIEILRETETYSISIDEIEDICFDLRCEVEDFEILFDCDLLKKNNDLFISESLCERMEKLDEIKEKRRIAGAKGGKRKASAKQLQSNKSKVKQSKEENSKEDEIKENTSNTTATEVTESVKKEFYLTSKKKKLSGKRLETFLIFWEKFNYKKSKAEAAQAWLDIPTLTDLMCDQIYSAAELESKQRPSIRSRGGTPKMAQGWITSRRWEDETELASSARDPKELQAQILKEMQKEREARR